MLYKTTIVAGLATAVAANGLAPAHAALHKRAVLARQTASTVPSATVGGDIAACATAAAALLTSLPTPPADLASALATVTITDVCSYSIPASLSAPLSSYESSLVSWASAHDAELSSAVSLCPDLSSAFQSIDDLTEGCATQTSGGSVSPTGTGSVTTTPTATGGAGGSGGSGTTGGGSGGSGTTGGGSGGASTTRSSSAGGARETAFVGAAMAAAGFLAVAAL
jgi:hypothetical protein